MPAVRCWPWGVFSSWLASRHLGTARSSYLAWVGPVVSGLADGRHAPFPFHNDWAVVYMRHNVDSCIHVVSLYIDNKHILNLNLKTVPPKMLSFPITPYEAWNGMTGPKHGCLTRLSYLTPAGVAVCCCIVDVQLLTGSTASSTVLRFDATS